MGFWKRSGDGDRGFIAGIGRLPFTLACALTAVVAIAVIALGGVRAPLDAARQALDLQELKALTPNIKYGRNTPNAFQYGSRVNVCVGGFVQLRLYTAQANALAGSGTVVLGQCTGTPPPEKSPRADVCVGGYIGLRLSSSQAQSLVSQGKAVSGKCP